MNKPLIVLSATPLLITALATFAGSAVDLSVKGAITPNACESVLSGGGVIDFGKMSAKELDPDKFTELPQQALHLSVRCEGATLFILSTIDNRAGTSALRPTWHGLGMTPNDEKLGSARFGLYNAVADTRAVRTITSLDGGITWAPSSYLGHYMLTAIAAADGVDLPIAVKEFDAELRLATHIVPSGDLTLIDEIPIDGSATLQLKYL